MPTRFLRGAVSLIEEAVKLALRGAARGGLTEEAAELVEGGGITVPPNSSAIASATYDPLTSVMPRKPLGDRPMTNAERQARHRATRAADLPVIHYRHAADQRSRARPLASPACSPGCCLIAAATG